MEALAAYNSSIKGHKEILVDEVVLKTNADTAKIEILEDPARGIDVATVKTFFGRYLSKNEGEQYNDRSPDPARENPSIHKKISSGFIHYSGISLRDRRDGVLAR